MEHSGRMNEPSPQQQSDASESRPWHHAPWHFLHERGMFMVTAGTLGKVHFFADGARLKLLHDRLLAVASELGWSLQAWAVFPNHYHFVAASPGAAGSLVRLIQKLHATTSAAINKLDNTPGRKVWHNYWETGLTYERSYLARLRYVHENAVHHGIVRVATQYPWCSAAHFAAHAPLSFQRTVEMMPIDKLHVQDEF